MTDYSIKRYNPYSNAELIERLRECAQEVGLTHVSSRWFSDTTGISETTIARHFGTWRLFCKHAGLAPRYQRLVSQDDLFENLDCVWQGLGRQPRAKEMKQPLSSISLSRYTKELQKPWYHVCLQFLAWKSGVTSDEIEREAAPVPLHGGSSQRLSRNISLSLRCDVLKRDRFRCLKCGRSPATEVGTQLHIAHIIPWAKGGQSILSNLQCLCSECNLGKSDRDNS